MILDKIAMCIGYIFMFIVALFIFVILPLAAIGRHHAEMNARIYERELDEPDS